MGLRYQKRVDFGKGAGLNISKSGISASKRTKYGTIGAKGFSIRTGIPGLTFRSSWSGKKSTPAIQIISMFLVVVFFLIIIVYNILIFILWLVKEIYHFILRKYYERQMKKENKISELQDTIQ